MTSVFGFQETASYNFHQVPIEDFQQAKVRDFFLVLSVSSIIDKDLKNSWVQYSLLSVCFIWIFHSIKLYTGKVFLLHYPFPIRIMMFYWSAMQTMDQGSGLTGMLLKTSMYYPHVHSHLFITITYISNPQILWSYFWLYWIQNNKVYIEVCFYWLGRN